VFEELDDEELLGLAGRRAEAFGVLYERHAEALLRFFARRTFDPDVAAELTAETFAEAFVSRKRFVPRGEGSAAGWLYAIGRHQLSRFWRRGAVAVRARDRLGMPDRELSEADFERVEELADLAAMRRAIGEAYRELSEEQRQAVLLRVVEGRPYDEVARMLGATEQAVRARVSRGLRRLSELLEGSVAEAAVVRGETS
jgi:RNA polymerase sigma factor (sigma-70 family)